MMFDLQMDLLLILSGASCDRRYYKIISRAVRPTPFYVLSFDIGSRIMTPICYATVTGLGIIAEQEVT